MTQTVQEVLLESIYHHHGLSTPLFHEWIGQLDVGGLLVEGLAPRFFVLSLMAAVDRIVL
jgi:hypothetical protein